MKHHLPFLLVTLALHSGATESDLQPIPSELPDAFFGGTPLDYWSNNFEPEDFKDRPPFLAPRGTRNVAIGKKVTSSTAKPLLGDLSQITDGDKSYEKESLVELEKGVQWVQIDLAQPHHIYAVLVWHFHQGKRVYFDVIVRISGDPKFQKGVTTLYNNDIDNSSKLGTGAKKEYAENNRGRLIDAKGAKARFVRLYSRGNTHNDQNHYVEVEVYGKSAAAEKEQSVPPDEETEPLKLEYPKPFFGGVPL